jgi:hypothetical protein
MANQHSVVLRAFIRPGKKDIVENLLTKSGNPAVANSPFPFKQFQEVHFARWVIIPGTVIKNKCIAPSVLYSAVSDVKVPEHFEQMATKAGDALDGIFEHCEGYPAEANRTPVTRLAFLNQHRLATQLFYSGSLKRTVRQIKNEADLHDAVAGFASEMRDKSITALQGISLIRKWLTESKRWAWALKPFSMPKKNWPGIVLTLLITFLLLPFLLIVFVLVHYFNERKSKPLGLDVNQLPPNRVERLKKEEDINHQNQFSQVLQTKPGLRRIVLRFGLWYGNQMSKYYLVEGSLFNTPTIHFAKFIIIDGGRRYLFLSNFDGSFDEYLGDFNSAGQWGLNLLYGNSEGYPRTRFVLGLGNYMFRQFLAWGRYYQVPTQAWYSAYPESGMPQINERSELRIGLFQGNIRSEEEALAVLRKI